jgi:predicted dithiol-disulfide oxidoreductase (DUF899 family)
MGDRMTSNEMLWPAASPAYAEARELLTEAEQELDRAAEALAKQRRALPHGSRVRDYAFLEGPRDIFGGDQPSTVRLPELFGSHPSVALYNFMFDGSTNQPCPMCTSLIDGYDGAAADLEQRVGFAVVAPAPLEPLRAYARQRGWQNVRLLADPEGTYSRDSGGLTADGELRSLMTVFTRRDGKVEHFYTARKPPGDEGQDDRHLDSTWALWGVLDLTREGRGTWRPARPPRR